MPISRIKTDGIQDDAITSAKIGDTNVATADIANSSVTSAKIADSSVTTAKIASGAVTSAKLDTNIAITGDLTVDTDTLKVDATNNRIGIGNTSPDRTVSIKHASQAELGFKTGSVSNGALIYYNDSENKLLLRAQESGERIEFQTGGTTARASITDNGICFGTDTAAANALDDYEEGAWTPNIGGNATYTNAQGTYTKIGRYVCASWDITINAIGTGQSNAMYGFPFTASLGSLGVNSGPVSFYSGIANNVYSVDCYIVANQTYIHFTGHTAASGNIANVIAVFQNGTRILGTVHYLAN